MRNGVANGTARAGISLYLVALLGAAMFLNYTDRGSLSIVAPLLKQQLGISNAAMGLLLSAFFWSYAIAQPAAGWVAQRFAPRTVLAAATALWSLATFACGLATGLAMLFVLRMLLGLAESVIFPTNARIFAEHAPEHQRGRCNSAMTVGQAMGPTAGTLLGAMDPHRLRLAGGILRARRGVAVVADPVARPARCIARDRSCPAPSARRLSRNPRPARAVGRVPRAILLFLPLLSRSHLAAALPRQQPASVARQHGLGHRRPLRASGNRLGVQRLGLRRPHPQRPIVDPGPQIVRHRRHGGNRRALRRAPRSPAD